MEITDLPQARLGLWKRMRGLLKLGVMARLAVLTLVLLVMVEALVKQVVVAPGIMRLTILLAP